MTLSPDEWLTNDTPLFLIAAATSATRIDTSRFVIVSEHTIVSFYLHGLKLIILFLSLFLCPSPYLPIVLCLK